MALLGADRPAMPGRVDRVTASRANGRFSRVRIRLYFLRLWLECNAGRKPTRMAAGSPGTRCSCFGGPIEVKWLVEIGGGFAGGNAQLC